LRQSDCRLQNKARKAARNREAKAALALLMTIKASRNSARPMTKPLSRST
jgi:hypothetical protein